MADNKPAKRWTPEKKREGLVALLFHGSAAAAGKATGIPPATLAYWRDQAETELWAQLNRDHGRQVEEAVTAQVREAIVAYGHLERKLLERLDANAHSIDIRDVSNALDKVQKGKATNVDKLLTLTGRPNTIVEHLDAKDLIGDIVRMFGPQPVDSTAEEEDG